MKLTDDQIVFYKENGYITIDNFLTEEEIVLLQAEFPNTIDRTSPRIIFENNGAIRSVFAPHYVNSIYNRLSKLARLVIPAEQLLESRVYLHQYKINTKKGFKGDWWEWHQDFPYWHIDDGISKPNMVSVLIYMQDTDGSNGALLLIPGSHKEGIAGFADKDRIRKKEKSRYTDNNRTSDYLSSVNSDIKFTIQQEKVKELAIKNGILTIAGNTGMALFFHGNIFHASNINLTPFDRDAIIITYNSIDNLPVNGTSPRPDFLAGRNYEPIDSLEKLI